MSERETSVIIKNDDYAGHEPTNKGIARLVEIGNVTDVSVIAQFVKEPERDLLLQAVDNSPLKENSGIGIVLHVNTVTGSPVSNPSDVPSLVNNEGKFLRPNKSTLPDWAEYAGSLVPSEVRREIDAQVEEFFRIFGHYPHALDSHNMILAYPPADEVAEQVALELGICLTAPKQFTKELHPFGGAFPEGFQVSQEIWERRKSLGIPGADNCDTEYYNRFSSLDESVNRLINALTNLQPGITEFFFHPGHPDYSKQVADPRFLSGRVRDFEILADPRITERLQQSNLVSYKKLYDLSQLN